MPAPKNDPDDNTPLDQETLAKLSLKSVWGAVSQVRTELRTHVKLNDQAHAFTAEKVEKIEKEVDRQGLVQTEQGRTLATVATHVEHLVKSADLQAEADARVGVAEKRAKIDDKKDTRRVLRRMGLKLFYALLAGAGLLCHAAVVKSCL